MQIVINGLPKNGAHTDQSYPSWNVEVFSLHSESFQDYDQDLQIPEVGGAMVPYDKNTLLYVGGWDFHGDEGWYKSDRIYQFYGHNSNAGFRISSAVFREVTNHHTLLSHSKRKHSVNSQGRSIQPMPAATPTPHPHSLTCEVREHYIGDKLMSAGKCPEGYAQEPDVYRKYSQLYTGICLLSSVM